MIPLSDLKPAVALSRFWKLITSSPNITPEYSPSSISCPFGMILSLFISYNHTMSSYRSEHKCKCGHSEAHHMDNKCEMCLRWKTKYPDIKWLEQHEFSADLSPESNILESERFRDAISRLDKYISRGFRGIPTRSIDRLPKG